MNTGNKKEECF